MEDGFYVGILKYQNFLFFLVQWRMDLDEPEKDAQGGWELVQAQEEKKKVNADKLVSFLDISVWFVNLQLNM